jgi:hypothetical protein
VNEVYSTGLAGELASDRPVATRVTMNMPLRICVWGSAASRREAAELKNGRVVL